ncbi:hypothetical protein G7Z17_g11608 [Cylindrodendrum hubeiense]|uniref:Rhodopsin domain-containing protein n=1 Tax=Cylindrodendrum hubeiense TaxID=595255 RepID=A0A9P5GX58_9HYPO|nr:hypothetical protein G7Z17_g11608 [Cylindrodendrum hubeiense]
MSMEIEGSGPVPILIVGWVLIAIATGVIIARLYLRIKIQRRRVIVSDVIMVAAWLVACAYTTTTIFLAKFVATFVVTYRVCYPVERLWSMDHNKACPGSRGKVIFIVNWSLNLAADFLAFLLPWLIVPGLNVPKMLKVGLYITFLLGLINICSSILRYVYTTKSQVGDAVPLSTVVLWATIESNLGLIISCLPSLRPYFSSSEKTAKHYHLPSRSSQSSKRRESGILSSRARPLSTDDDLWDNQQVNGSEVEVVMEKSESDEFESALEAV